MSNIVTLIEPDTVRVNFDEDTGTIILIDSSAEEVGSCVSIPASSWPAIAKAVSKALRSYRNSDST